MRRRILKAIGALVAVAIAAILVLVVWAGWPRNANGIVFRTLASERDAFVIQPLINALIRFGIVVQNPARDYPGSFYATYRKQCSGTLVGRDTILISAHCLEESGKVEILTPLGRRDAHCTQHQRYKRPPAYDIALCKIQGKPLIDRGFEQIARPPFRLPSSAPIRVSGWGYSESSAFKMWLVRVKLTLGLGGEFRIGRATGTEQGPLIVARGDMTGQGQVALDQGDSGGAAYVGADGARRVVGTNSCGGSGCGLSEADNIAVVNLVDGEIAKFIEEWADSTGAHICGRVPSMDEGCHN